MKRRDFFSFITGLLAGSLLPWRHERVAPLPTVWVERGPVDPLPWLTSAGRVGYADLTEEDFFKFYRQMHRKIGREGQQDDLAGWFLKDSPAWKKVYTGVSPGVIHVEEIG